MRTPLFAYHRAHAQKLVNFHGWEMPLYFSGIRDEHFAVRSRAGFFDVSHMGKIQVTGAASELQFLVPSRLPLQTGGCRYTFLLDGEGRILDDTILCRLSNKSFLFVSNAGPRDRIVAWFEDHLGRNHVQDCTSDLVCLALQGPKAEAALQPFSSSPLGGLRSFRGTPTEIPKDAPVETEGWASLSDFLELETSFGPRTYYLTRTGYTGEIGFEIYAPNSLGVALWTALVGDSGIPPVGLGARDTLRLEKGYLLSGQDFNGSQTPFEVGYARVVHWDHDFVGREALRIQAEETGYRRLQGVQLLEPGVLRPGYAVWQRNRAVGTLTSGTFSPTLGIGIGIGYLEDEAREPGQALEVEVRKKRLRAVATAPPFV
ncbi:MAG: glycine cleavage system aminomethyltransferase GcvT [Candidatus Methylomirabilales bacterium]